MEYKKTTLNNNLRVVTVPKPGSPTTTVLVLVEAGSAFETKNINGLSHFLEHMVFKGTEKRPRSIDIASELDGLGAAYNAFTSVDCTGYYAKAANENFDKILDVVSDIYLHSTFDQKEIDKERGVIIEEINMYEDLPMRNVGDLFTSLLYGDQPAGWNVAGEKEIIKQLSREDFLKYHKDRYLSGSTVVVVAGDINEEDAIKKVEQAFVGTNAGRGSARVKILEEQSAPRILLKNKKSDQTHLVIGVRAFDAFDNRRFALQILSDILGGSMSSRLFQKVREELGAAYYVRSGSDLYFDHGYLGISAGIDNGRILQVTEAILGVVRELTNSPVGEKELEMSKEHFVGNMLMDIETSDQLANFYGGMEVVNGQILTAEETIKRIRSVSAPEISSLAKELFRNDRLNMVAITPFEDKEKLQNTLTLE